MYLDVCINFPLYAYGAESIVHVSSPIAKYVVRIANFASGCTLNQQLIKFKVIMKAIGNTFFLPDEYTIWYSKQRYM